MQYLDIDGVSKIKNYIDGKVSGKADKVSGATNGNLAKLDSNGNLADAGVAMPSISGNGWKVLAVNSGATGMEWVAQKDIKPATLATEKKTDQEFVYRACPQTIGANALTLDRIKGNTLVWNQMFSANPTIPTSANKGTLSVDSTGRKYTYTVSEVGSNRWDNRIVCYPQVRILSGHKYFVSFGIKPKSTTNISVSGNNLSREVIITGMVANDNNLAHAILDFTNYSGNQFWINLACNAGGYSANDTVEITDIVFIDLTLMFGEGNEPSTAAEFEALYPGYHDYSAGKLISNDAAAIETVGFNKWDEVWEVGGYIYASGAKYTTNDRIQNVSPIRVLPNTAYYVKNSTGVGLYVFEYDANGGYIGYILPVNNREFTTPSNCAYINICNDPTTTYTPGNVCISLSDPAKNGTYEPYRKSVMQLNLGSFQVRDSQGNVTTITGGLKSAGSVYDEIVGNKYIKRVGEVDLGSLNWYLSSANVSIFRNSLEDLPNIKPAPYSSSLVNAISARYTQKAYSPIQQSDNLCFAISDISNNRAVFINHAYTDVVAFKAAMSGVYLYYELANEEVYDLAEPLVMTMRAGTTEEAISPNADGISAPFCCDMTYGESVADAIDGVLANATKIENLKNSIPDTSNFIQKSQTAGLLKNDGTVDTTSYGTYSKPADGIPAADLASGVIPSALPASDVYAWAKASSKPNYTASDVGLGNVGNFKAVSTEANQGLTSTEQANARANIGAGTSSFDGNYNSLTNKPSSLPASDVYSWAKAENKPSYSYSEISGTPNSLPASDVYDWAKAASKPSYSFSEINGVVASNQLPSYVDDVLEYTTTSAFPVSGESGKIYLATSTNLTYRWSGSGYVEISPSLALGETSSTAYAGDKGAALASKLATIEQGAQVHRAPTSAEVKSALGTGSGTTKYLREDGTWQTPPDTDTHQNVSSNNNTASWGSAVVVGTVGSTELKFTMPSNPNTDTNTWRPIKVGGESKLSDTSTAINFTGSGATQVSYDSSTNSVVITSTDTNTHPSVSSDNNTASWGSSVTVGTVGGTDLKFTMPANPNTDTNTWRPISDAVDSTSSDTSASSKAVKTAYDLAASKTSNAGTVTSVSAGTGLSISGTSTVNPTVNVASGYKLPTTTEWGNKAESSAIPSVSDATITIKQSGVADQSFTLNGNSATITLNDTNTWRPLGTGATDACAGNDSRLNPEVFWATYGSTTYDEMTNAISSGKTIMINYNNRIYYYVGRSHGFSFMSIDTYNSIIYFIIAIESAVISPQNVTTYSIGTWLNSSTDFCTRISNGSSVDSPYVDPINGTVDISSLLPSAPGTLNTNNASAQSVDSSEALSGTINLHKVAKTGTYSDLIGTPTIPSAPGTLVTNATTGQTASAGEAMSGTITLHKVAKTGSYTDLLNQPTIPTVPTISTNVVTDKASDTKTSSPKSVYNEIHPANGSSQPSGGMLPNVFYNLGTLSGNTTFSIASPSDSSVYNEYMFQFTTPSTAPTITWPNGTSFLGGSAPTINASKTYQVSIVNNLIVVGEF